MPLPKIALDLEVIRLLKEASDLPIDDDDDDEEEEFEEVLFENIGLLEVTKTLTSLDRSNRRCIMWRKLVPSPSSSFITSSA